MNNNYQTMETQDSKTDIDFLLSCLKSNYKANYDQNLEYEYINNGDQIRILGQHLEEMLEHIGVLKRLKATGYGCNLGLRLYYEITEDLGSIINYFNTDPTTDTRIIKRDESFISINELDTIKISPAWNIICFFELYLLSQ